MTARPLLYARKEISGSVQVPRGLGTPPQNVEKTPTSARGGANSGAFDPDFRSNDSHLQAVIDAWPTLPEAIRTGILAMVEAATDTLTN
jgi:hypothetical protein